MTAPLLEVILTHEHTDFDALASLLGAALLDPQATPVLPRIMNRNVSEFVRLHRSNLPFVEPGDLPRGRIARVTLVDTRALNLPRGLAPNAEVVVIDHHTEGPDGDRPPQLGQRDQPATWSVWSEPVGANATLLVERLMEAQTPLRPLHATLLALGIHEDTGSLTYGGTTWRDARALAWLLEPERGVNLDTLNRFLSHPLSAEQRTLLDELIASSEVVSVEGHTVVLAQSKAPRQIDEISTIAGRLRDFHEQDAVFLIIELGDMVQMVARSTTDEVDVGEVARALGGGGHTRAAAAAIRSHSTAAIRDEIVEQLRRQIRAQTTVEHIMSRGAPHTLVPDMAVDAAAELMSRYGHEGFPVVAGAGGAGTLLGVLTRREADRAISHGLGSEPVRRFMRSGDVSVQPQDSLSVLRRTMIDSGWGQIPVVDAEGRIIGIVTRTDLIKTWDEGAGAEHRTADMERRLDASLSPTQIEVLRLLGREAADLDATVYVVGGFVRDLLLEQLAGRVQSFDLDIVLEGDGIRFARHLRDRYGGRVVEHRQFNTAKWILNDPDTPVSEELRALATQAAGIESLPAHLDFVSARTEFYTAPTVLPTVENSSIKLDLHRRDFTINTLALCLNPDRWGQLLDFWGGVNDLHNGLVRVLHSLSFVDDPTRILRAVRYEQRFGFAIDSRTLELIDDALDLLERVTPARLRHELERILQEAAPEQMFVRLDELHALAQIHPSLIADGWVLRSFPVIRAVWQGTLLPSSDPPLRLAALPAPVAATLTDDLRREPLPRLYWGALVHPVAPTQDDALTERLGLRRDTQHFVRDLRILQENLATLHQDSLRPSEAVAILDRVSLAAAALAVLLEDDAALAELLHRYRSEWCTIHAELNGDDLLTMGLAPGPAFRELLGQLRAARLDGQAQSRSDEEALVRAWMGG
jgi:tRNA nucleotidyltransferase (CCA-adding enzyme)